MPGSSRGIGVGIQWGCGNRTGFPWRVGTESSTCLANKVIPEAFATDPSTAVVRAFRHAVKEEGGDDTIDMMRGWGDVEFVATDYGVPTIYFGPGTVAAAHTADEYIDLDRYHMSVGVYERAIQEFLVTTKAS